MASITVSTIIPACPGCCCSCDFGATVSVTLAGITLCIGTNYDVSLTHRYTLSAATDPNGVHDVDWISSCATGGGQLVIGTATLDHYLLIDGEWEFQQSFTFDINLDVVCDAGVLRVIAAWAFALPEIFLIFYDAEGMAAGVPADNLLLACDFLGSASYAAGTGGTAVVEP